MLGLETNKTKAYIACMQRKTFHTCLRAREPAPCTPCAFSIACRSNRLLVPSRSEFVARQPTRSVASSFCGPCQGFTDGYQFSFVKDGRRAAGQSKSDAHPSRSELSLILRYLSKKTLIDHVMIQSQGRCSGMTERANSGNQRKKASSREDN